MKKNIDLNSEKIKQLEDQINELTNNWKRALADYQNLERRSKEEKEQFAKYAKANLISELLPVLDSFDRLKDQIQDKGLTLTLKSFRETLEKQGLKKIEALGCDFNPHLMEAVELVAGEEGKIIVVTRSGYTLYDKVLRPVQVKTGDGQGKNNIKN